MYIYIYICIYRVQYSISIAWYISCSGSAVAACAKEEAADFLPPFVRGFTSNGDGLLEAQRAESVVCLEAGSSHLIIRGVSKHVVLYRPWKRVLEGISV